MTRNYHELLFRFQIAVCQIMCMTLSRDNGDFPVISVLAANDNVPLGNCSPINPPLTQSLDYPVATDSCHLTFPFRPIRYVLTQSLNFSQKSLRMVGYKVKDIY